jgi:hypothetical protein
MNLRCAFCQTPYTLGRVDKLIALQHMETEKLSHYDAHCPRCRKATPVQRKMMEATFPNWREALHELEMQAEAVADAPQGTPASSPKPEPDVAAQADSKADAMPAKAQIKGATKAKPPSKRNIGQPQAARSELGRKPPAKNTPGKKKSK